MAITRFGKRFEADAGSIALWAGNIADIPSGWAICDGNNGTPDLLGYFSRSVPDSSTSPGATGGQQTYTLSIAQLPQHEHGGSTDGAGGHTHESFVGGSIDTNDGSAGDNPEVTAGGSATTSTGSHNHDTSTDTVGGNASINNEPSYYEVAYIMKL